MTNQNSGYADIVLGLQYGDEGKARVVDMLAPNYDIVARFNGGANAGHTIETKEGGKVALNQVPSAIFYPETTLYVGSGCAINFQKLLKEVENIEALGVKLEGRFHISPQATVVQPHHLIIDGITGGKVGTTKNGIGPCYADLAKRTNPQSIANIRTGDFLNDPESAFKDVETNLRMAHKYHDFDLQEGLDLLAKMRTAVTVISKFIEKDPLFLQKQVEQGKSVLFEGAQAVMLDVSKGSVPYVTSSNTTAAAAYTGGDLSPNYHRKTIGVVKAIMSRVGHGPFTSAFGGAKSEEYSMNAPADGGPEYGRAVEKEYDLEKYLSSPDEFEMGVALRILSGEYGTVSTRPRRVGALDLVQLNYAISMNNVTDLVITKCDLLNAYAKTHKAQSPLVKGYTLNGEAIDYLPGSTGAYYQTEATVEYLPAFSEDISEVRDPQNLPEAMHTFIKAVEDFTHCTVIGLGVGPEREQYVKIA